MDPTLAAIDDALACDFGRTHTRYGLGGETTRYVCAIDGERVAVIEIFAKERREDVVRWLSGRYESLDPFECGGAMVTGAWTYVGDTFAVTTYREPLIRQLAKELRGEYVGGGATPEEPPAGPPVSYDVPC